MSFACQTCLRVIINPSTEGIYLSSNNARWDTIPLIKKLSDCVPELLLDSVDCPMICNFCEDALSSFFRFRQKCLESQQKINEYLEKLPAGTSTNTGEIATHYRNLDVITNGGETVAEETEGNIRTSTMPYKCYQCSFSCVDRCILRYHKIMHHSPGADRSPFKCDECILLFRTPLLLLEHLARHTNENPFACKMCDYMTSTCKNLKQHCWIHRDRFQCKVCWKRFAQKPDLQIHLINHDAEMEVLKYQCGWCDYKSNTIKFLDFHLNTQHKEVLKCKKCWFECRTVSRLTEHVANRHEINPKQVHSLIMDSAPTVLADNVKIERSTTQENNNSVFKKIPRTSYLCNFDVSSTKTAEITVADISEEVKLDVIPSDIKKDTNLISSSTNETGERKEKDIENNTGIRELAKPSSIVTCYKELNRGVAKKKPRYRIKRKTRWCNEVGEFVMKTREEMLDIRKRGLLDGFVLGMSSTDPSANKASLFERDYSLQMLDERPIIACPKRAKPGFGVTYKSATS